MKTRFWLPYFLAMGCMGSGIESIERIDVPDNNELGVVSIEIDHHENNGDKVFELRGLDTSGEQRALVRLRVGVIVDLPTYLSGSDVAGSEIIVEAAGHTRRDISREVELYQLIPVEDHAVQQFLELGVVSSALQREANIFVQPASNGVESAYSSGVTCPAIDVLTTPPTTQCCFSSGTTYPGTFFFNPSNAAVRRVGPGTPCTTSSGGTCSANGCYYGPLGFARPVVTPPPSGGPWYPYTGFDSIPGSTGCGGTWYSIKFPPIFGNVTGYGPHNYPNCGCCANGGGPCCGTVCTVCGGVTGGWNY